MNSLEHYRNQKWIIGVSGGPDSMVLLDLAFRHGVNCVVVHVNYQKRDTAKRDQELVQLYCNKHNIEYYVFNAIEFKGNFQDQAREYRYSRFKEVALIENALGVLVAHHKDDDLETLIFQIQRQSKVEYYGLTSTTYIQGIRVDRPLLSYTKKDCIDYCVKHNISYGWDESNDSLDYTRNRIRKEVVSLSTNEIEELMKIKENYNQQRKAFLEEHKELLNQTSISHNLYTTHLHNRKWFLLEWLRIQTKKSVLSNRYIDELDRQLIESKSVKQHITPSIRIIKQYDLIQIVKDVEDYCYDLDYLETVNKEIKMSYEYQKGYRKIAIPKDAYPIQITNLRACKSRLQANIYTKLSRWFIKNKIPIQEREMWPLVFSKQNELLYILDVSYEHGVSTDTIECYMIK